MRSSVNVHSIKTIQYVHDILKYLINNKGSYVKFEQKGLRTSILVFSKNDRRTKHHVREDMYDSILRHWLVVKERTYYTLKSATNIKLLRAFERKYSKKLKKRRKNALL